MSNEEEKKPKEYGIYDLIEEDLSQKYGPKKKKQE